MEDLKEKHETCDGCQMFSESGCMIDDSCPECVEHHLWTPKAKQIIKPNEGCDAEYFFCKWFEINSIPKHNMILPGHYICELMEEYHKQKLRSELVKIGGQTYILNQNEMTTEEKIMAIFKDHQVTHGGLTLVTKEIAALIEPYQKLIEVMDEYNDYLKTRRHYDPIIQATYDTKINQFKQQINET